MSAGDAQARVQAAIDHRVASGDEAGVQVAVVARGRVVDAVSGSTDRDILTADIPSEGTMTARGAALLYAALLGDVDGVGLVSPERRAAMAAVRFEGKDEVMGIPSTWVFGFSPQRPGGVPSRPGSTFGMAGMNGSAAYADIDSGVAVAVMRSRCHPELAVVGEVDRIVADTWPSRVRARTRREE